MEKETLQSRRLTEQKSNKIHFLTVDPLLFLNIIQNKTVWSAHLSIEEEEEEEEERITTRIDIYIY
jgi:hypothetical protein